MMLTLSNVHKRFGAVHALAGLDLQVQQGEVHALCGQNGAGKSTLFKLLSGLLTADSGAMTLDGKAFSPRSVRQAEQAGLAIVHQELAIAPELTVAANVCLGREPTRFLLIDEPETMRIAERSLAELSARIDPRSRAGDLSIGEQQLVEIARALSKRCRVLLLDEPTAALSERESAALMDRVSSLARSGVTCVYVSHRLDEVFAIASRITVIRDGRTVMTQRTQDTSKAEVASAMIGRELSSFYPRASRTKGNVRLSVRDLAVQGNRQTLDGVSFDAHAGEVVGLFGLLGAGRSELLMHLFGAYGARTNGTVSLDCATPERAMRAGIGLVPEERRRQGLFFSQNVDFHLRIAGAPAASDERAVATLSGGNQQKVVLKKCLAHDPTLVLLDEPTRGIDVGAKHDIYESLNGLAQAGKCILWASSELQELTAMCDRIIVLSGGQLTGDFAPDAPQHTLLAAALQHA